MTAVESDQSITDTHTRKQTTVCLSLVASSHGRTGARIRTYIRLYIAVIAV